MLLKARGNGPIDQKPELDAIHASVYHFNIISVHIECIILEQLASVSCFANGMAEVRFSWMMLNHRDEANLLASTTSEMR